MAVCFVVPIPQAVQTSWTTRYNGKSQRATKTMTTAIMSETNTIPGLGLSVSALTGGLCTCACACVCPCTSREAMLYTQIGCKGLSANESKSSICVSLIERVAIQNPVN